METGLFLPLSIYNLVVYYIPSFPSSIKNRGVYLHMELSCKREVQKKFIEYTQSILTHDPKIEELIDWENKEETLKWLDSL